MSRRRPAPFETDGPTLVNVVSVVTHDGNFALWTFDQDVATIPDASGLQVLGNAAASANFTANPRVIDIDYETGVTTGDDWSAVDAVAGITFTVGTLAPDQTGIAE